MTAGTAGSPYRTALSIKLLHIIEKMVAAAGRRVDEAKLPWTLLPSDTAIQPLVIGSIVGVIKAVGSLIVVLAASLLMTAIAGAKLW